MPFKISGELFSSHVEWMILVMLFPIVVTINSARSFLLIFMLAPFYIRYTKNRSLIAKTPFNLSLFGLLCMILISLFVTYDISFSLRKVVSLTWGVFLFWAIQDSLQANRTNKYWLVGLLCILGFSVSLIALFNPSISLRIPGGDALFSILSTIPNSDRLQKINPNEIGGVLAWCIPLSYSFSFSFVQRNRQRQVSNILLNPVLWVLLIAPLLPMLVILYFTASRTAIGSTILSLFLITWLLIRKWGWIRWTIVSMGLLVMLLVAAFYVDSNSLASLFFETSDFGTVTLNGRIEIWSRALYGIQDFPFTGMGMNNFREIVHILYPLFQIPEDTDIAHAHNQFLQVALDLGVPGLVFYISIWLSSCFLLVKSWKNNIQGSIRQVLVAGLAGSMLASFVFGLTDAIALGAIPSFIFWLLLSIISSLYHETINQPLDSRCNN